MQTAGNTLKPDFLRIIARNVSMSRVAIAHMHLEKCGLQIERFENLGRKDYDNTQRGCNS